MAAWTWTEELRQLAEAHYPGDRDDPPPGMFEVALACAGATSTAAYTAGVLDFLFEALDEWERLKREAPASVPQHAVLLRAMIGTSGGGMSLAIAAAHATRAFPPVKDADVRALLDARKHKDPREIDEATSRLARNPLFASWVLGIDFVEGRDPMTGEALPGLGTRWKRPRSADQPPSIFNCEIIDALGYSAIACGKPQAGQERKRAWLADPLELRLTVTNLNGVPFNVTFSGAELGQIFLESRDEIAFAVQTGGTRPSDLTKFQEILKAAPPDCVFLHADADRLANGPWGVLSTAAMATGALPFALETRKLTQLRTAYRWRTMRPVEQEWSSRAPFYPDDVDADDFYATDGGFTHDPPFEYARVRLAGFRGRNPREGDKANRALILIDPLLGGERRRRVDGVISTAMSMIMAPVEQARMDAAQVLDILDDRVYSRFMIAPSRSHPLMRDANRRLNGSVALPSAGVHALLGFASLEYRAHDFLLGRRNAQKMLKDVFAVPAENPIVVHGQWNEACRRDYCAASDDPSRPAHFQVIPVCGRAAEPIAAPEWPAGALRTDKAAWRNLSKLIEERFNVMGKQLADELAPGNWVAKAALPFAMKKYVARGLIKAMAEAVDKVNDGLPGA